MVTITTVMRVHAPCIAVWVVPTVVAAIVVWVVLTVVTAIVVCACQ